MQMRDVFLSTSFVRRVSPCLDCFLEGVCDPGNRFEYLRFAMVCVSETKQRTEPGFGFVLSRARPKESLEPEMQNLSVAELQSRLHVTPLSKAAMQS